MFEKESMKDYVDNLEGKIEVNNESRLEEQFEDTFIRGAICGYNKANEWHYPSKGEYPKERQLVLGIFQPSEYYTPTELVFYGKELDCWSNQMGDSEYHNIYAWKEIVLPELKENE